MELLRRLDRAAKQQRLPALRRPARAGAGVLATLSSGLGGALEHGARLLGARRLVFVEAAAEACDGFGDVAVVELAAQVAAGDLALGALPRVG